MSSILVPSFLVAMFLLQLLHALRIDLIAFVVKVAFAAKLIHRLYTLTLIDLTSPDDL
jgi:hypothetical protein